MVKNYIFLGAPGVGKGTLADLVAKEAKIVHISTGAIFRAKIKSNTALGKKVQSIMAEGQYVPDEITNAIVFKRLAQADVKTYGSILDGYPRTLNQSQFLIDNDIKIDKVILLKANKKLLLKRLSGRRTCPVCKSGYNIEFMPPKVANHCDKDNAILIQREDDKPKAILERLKVFDQQTKVLINFYKDKNMLDEIDGSQSPKDTLKNFMELYCD